MLKTHQKLSQFQESCFIQANPISFLTQSKASIAPMAIPYIWSALQTVCFGATQKGQPTP